MKTTIPLAICFGAAVSACANPQGMTVVSGAAHAQQTPNQLTIQASQNAVLQWNSFNIAAWESTVFQQPSAASVVWNKIFDANPSVIYGSLRANGVVVLMNQNGFYFGPNAFVQAAGLFVTTAPFEPGSVGGANWQFTGPPVAKSIVNYGTLQTTHGGALFVIADQIQNFGTIQAPGGKVGLLAGQEVLVSDRADGLGVSARVTLPLGSVDNEGRVVADAGTVLMQAQAVNEGGLVQANSIRQQNGTIELLAGDSVELAAGSVIQANGDDSGSSPGGTITIKSDGAYSDAATSGIIAQGGGHGGDGGAIEISAPNIRSLNSMINANAQAGWKGGSFLIDPENITLGSSGATVPDGNGVIDGAGASGTLNVNVNSAFQNVTASQILLEASGNITLSQNTTWNLTTSVGNRTSGQVTLEAGGDIIFGSGSKITDANDWSLSLMAGMSFASGNVQSGVGNIYLNGGNGQAGSGTIQTAAGSITLQAGNSVQVGAGAVRTSGGGSISVTTIAGSVNTGTDNNGFDFETVSPGYKVDSLLGGISTIAGGNVTINSGQDVVSFLPPATSATGTDAGAGAFGSQPGNVTISAARNVTGHYVVMNGAGTITANGNAGTSSAQLALSLVKGSWTVTAGNSITLQEVRDPNGTQNSITHAGNPYKNFFDYDPGASVTLTAGNQITLTGNSVPRGGGLQVPVIYPPTLNLFAGAGGILLGSGITLYPSPVGNLSITTVNGGSLETTEANVNEYLALSDSDRQQWTEINDFTPGDVGNNTLHLNDPIPVTINVSGAVRDLDIFSAKPVHMAVTGTGYEGYSIYDTGVSAINLKPSDQTTISATGAIGFRSSYTFEAIPSGDAPPDLSLLANSSDPTVGEIAKDFVYLASTGQLGYLAADGPMTLKQLTALEAVNFVDPSVLSQLYKDCQDVPTTSPSGFTIAGQGTFRIQAASLDLGTSGGISSIGFPSPVGQVPALAPYIKRGADIDIALSGGLEMLSTTITSEYGGNIDISAGGAIDIGTQELPVSGAQPRGITALWHGNISVVAKGNIEVNGSRIATYDGGNIFVESLDGNVDAGSGGNGSVYVQKPFLDANGKLQLAPEGIPGSGILATSYPELVYNQKKSYFGNITIETPKGNITASKGGIVQLAIGPAVAQGGTIDLVAGSPGYIGNIDTSGSGVIGSQVNLQATGNITGLVVASAGANIASKENVNITVLAKGDVSVTAVGSVSGTIAGIGSVAVSGDAVSASLTGGSVAASGNVSGAAASAVGPSAGASSAATASQATVQNSLASPGPSDSEDNRRRGERPQLAEYTGRVTVTPRQ